MAKIIADRTRQRSSGETRERDRNGTLGIGNFPESGILEIALFIGAHLGSQELSSGEFRDRDSGNVSTAPTVETAKVLM